MQEGRNAFLLCAAYGHLAVAQYLAPKMEDHLFDTDESGYTALHWAAQEGQFTMVEYLVKSCGFDLKAVDKVGLQDLLCYLSNAFYAFSGHTCCMGTVDIDNCTYQLQN